MYGYLDKKKGRSTVATGARTECMAMSNEWVCDNCGRWQLSEELPYGWNYDGPGCGAVICESCWDEWRGYAMDLLRMSSPDPVDPTP